jgi:hypothetical protein
VFPGCRVAEVQLLGESDEVAQLAQLHIASPPRFASMDLSQTAKRKPEKSTGHPSDHQAAAIGARDKPCAN